MSGRLTLAITLGDAGGIGPEVAIKAACGATWPDRLQLVLVGSRAVVADVCRRLRWRAPRVWEPGRGTGAAVWEPPGCARIQPHPGRVRVDAARCAFDWIRAAVRGCADGTFDGMVTAPIHKAGFQRAGLAASGHTELLAELTGTRRFAMMLIGGPLRVVLVTRHVPLAAVASHLSAEAILQAGELAAQALPWLGVRCRRLAVCGLNPHAGDAGAIGREDQTVIRPAIQRLRRLGVEAEGPVPGDVVFHLARRGRYGAVLAMYHDQGLGPLKMLAFETGVNVTLGLPIVRTSPDHGTAMDIAGRGVANPASMVAAIRLAARLARRHNPWASGGRP